MLAMLAVYEIGIGDCQRNVLKLNIGRAGCAGWSSTYSSVSQAVIAPRQLATQNPRAWQDSTS